MKVCVIILSEDATAGAGVRIRYNRIGASLTATGHQCRLALIQDVLRGNPPDDDVFILSKCYDVRSLIVAGRLREAGKVIGIDLFDDYFSQVCDSRFLRFRTWLASVVPLIDFVLCSTPTMKEVSEPFVNGLPIHVMNDPAPDCDEVNLRAGLAAKRNEALRSRVVKVCWFGMGDNPHFPVGLADLAAFGGALARMHGRGFNVRLAICTNARSLTADTLARLRTLPVPYSLCEWDLDAERALLDDSLVAFIPVNAQTFSIVKSLNRALSALTHGNQVLSPGYPLYDPLASFIYDDPATLMADIAAGTPLLSEGTTADFLRLTAEIGSAARESADLVLLLDGLLAQRSSPRPAAAEPVPFAVIHGVRALKDVHLFAKATGILSVASPYCEEDWPFDVVVRFRAAPQGFEVLLAEHVWLGLSGRAIARLQPPREIGGRRYRALGLSVSAAGTVPTPGGISASIHPIQVMAGFRSVIAFVEDALGEIFPGIVCLLSDRSVFPFNADCGADILGLPETKEAIVA